MDRRQLATGAGIIGPTLFVAIFTFEGWLRPSYKPRGMVVSELALGPRGWIQRVNFVVFGVLSLVFTRGIAAEFQEGKASRAGPILRRALTAAGGTECLESMDWSHSTIGPGHLLELALHLCVGTPRAK